MPHIRLYSHKFSQIFPLPEKSYCTYKTRRVRVNITAKLFSGAREQRTLRKIHAGDMFFGNAPRQSRSCCQSRAALEPLHACPTSSSPEYIPFRNTSKNRKSIYCWVLFVNPPETLWRTHLSTRSGIHFAWSSRGGKNPRQWPGSLAGRCPT